uniref:CENP-V/GFA domain-containing protein n=1 Tax=Oreochromis aureus TaxID=47969 RepID=A0AAZ1X571_OREAU
MFFIAIAAFAQRSKIIISLRQKIASRSYRKVRLEEFSLCGRIKGLENLTTYTFNTHVAKHTFCKTCGVQSFYTPRSNPDGYGIAPHCLDPGTVHSVTVENFCGEKWEESMQVHKTIRDMSKPEEN